MDEFNPYAAPKAEVITQNTEAEAIRRQHINHEASIKSVGCLYGLVALALVIALIVVGADLMEQSLSAVGVLAGLAVLAGVVAAGLRNLRRWASILAALWSAILVVAGLLNLPRSIIQLLIFAFILWLMVSPKGIFVTSARYRAIIAQTPHVKRRTSVVVSVLLVLILLIVASGIFNAMRS